MLLNVFEIRENFQTMTLFLFRFIVLDQSQTLFLDFEIRLSCFLPNEFSAKTRSCFFILNFQWITYQDTKETDNIFHSQCVSDDSKDHTVYFQSNAFLCKIITVFRHIYTIQHSFSDYICLFQLVNSCSHIHPKHTHDLHSFFFLSHAFKKYKISGWKCSNIYLWIREDYREGEKKNLWERKEEEEKDKGIEEKTSIDPEEGTIK